MAELLTNDTDLTAVANAIRTKTGKSAGMSFPNGFVSEIGGIGSYGSDAASASHILSGKKAFVGNATVTGNIASKGAETYRVSTSNRTISSGKYLSGDQVVKGVKISNDLIAGNIKKDVRIQIGDDAGAGLLKDVTGSCQEVYTDLPQTSDGYVPFMMQTNDALTLGFYRVTRGSGSYEAVRSAGYRIAAANSGTKKFKVPCPIKMTYFSSDTTNNASTFTFQPGTEYTLSGYSNVVGYISGSGINTTVYKVVQWERA